VEAYKSYPTAGDVRSSASSTSMLVDSPRTMSDSLSCSVSGDSCMDVTTFGDTRRMVHCLAEHVVYGSYTSS